MRLLLRMFRALLILGLVGVVLGIVALFSAYRYVAPELPDIETLKEIRLQVPLRVFSRDGLNVGQILVNEAGIIREDRILRETGALAEHALQAGIKAHFLLDLHAGQRVFANAFFFEARKAGFQSRFSSSWR